MKVISRKDANRAGKRYYYTGYACLNGHYAQRYTSGCECTQCALTKAKARQASDPEKFRVYAKRYYASKRIMASEALKCTM